MLSGDVTCPCPAADKMDKKVQKTKEKIKKAERQVYYY